MSSGMKRKGTGSTNESTRRTRAKTEAGPLTTNTETRTEKTEKTAKGPVATDVQRAEWKYLSSTDKETLNTLVRSTWEHEDEYIQSFG